MAPLSFVATDQPEYDIRTTISVRDPFAITWNAGLLYEPPEGRWAAGLAFVPPVDFHAEGSLQADLSGNAYYTGDSNMGQLIAVPTAQDDDIYLDVTMPMILSAGGLFRPGDRLELELDVAWERWSSMGSLTLSGNDMLIDLVDDYDDVVLTDDIVLPTTLQDAVSVRLGGEGLIKPWVTGRAGLLFETSAVPEAYEQVMLPDGMKFGYGLGVSFHLLPSRLDLDLGWLQSFVLPHELDRSQVFQVQVGPDTGEVGLGKQVGNGVFGVTNTVFGLGINWMPG